jgi:hypothetical protein
MKFFGVAEMMSLDIGSLVIVLLRLPKLRFPIGASDGESQWPSGCPSSRLSAPSPSISSELACLPVTTQLPLLGLGLCSIIRCMSIAGLSNNPPPGSSAALLAERALGPSREASSGVSSAGPAGHGYERPRFDTLERAGYARIVRIPSTVFSRRLKGRF